MILILGAMLERPVDEWYGLELVERVELKTGTIYPALVRLEQAGWLTSHWEDVNPSEEGRPRRRLYRMTGEGQARAQEEVSAHMTKLSGTGRRAPGRPHPRASSNPSAA